MILRSTTHKMIWPAAYIKLGPNWWVRETGPGLEILFWGTRNLWLILLLSGILCGIISSLRIRKNFFDFSWFKLLRALFRFHITYKRKCEMLLDINRHDGSVDRAIGSDSQGCVFKPHQGQNFFLFFLIFYI